MLSKWKSQQQYLGTKVTGGEEGQTFDTMLAHGVGSKHEKVVRIFLSRLVSPGLLSFHQIGNLLIYP